MSDRLETPRTTLRDRSRRLLPALLASVGLLGCSPVLNSLTGLTTPQGTISGSNYVLGVREADRCLVSRELMESASSPIGPNDRFSIDLDFGFVRYFQAVDPYVLGYAASWMGPAAAPTDAEKLHQQIFLHKEGVTQNARLPITGVPLIGPVTMGDDEMPVHVTVKIVTLSKYDNAQTISLIEQLANTAATAQPQYALAAHAAGALGAAAIAQNRDKLEFEHTFTFWPDGLAVPASTEQETNLVLRPGRWVVMKGESEARAIPYQTWYYYLWPFNWLGHSAAGESRRYEAEDSWRYCPNPSKQIGTGWAALRAVPWALSCVPRVPFYLLGDILLAGGVDYATGTPLTQLRADADYLTRNRDCGWQDPDVTSRSGKGLGGWSIYSEKTHVVVGLRRTTGTFGDFSTLATKFSDEARLVNELTTNRAEYETESSKRLADAFDKIRDVAVAEHARDASSQKIDKGGDVSSENFCSTGLSCDERAKLVDAAIEKQSRQARDLFFQVAKRFVDKRVSDRDTATKNAEAAKNAKAAAEEKGDAAGVADNDAKMNGWLDAINKANTDLGTIWDTLQAFAEEHKWAAPNTGVGEWNCNWQKAWKSVVRATHSHVRPLVEKAAPSVADWKAEKIAELGKLGDDACTNASASPCKECTKTTEKKPDAAKGESKPGESKLADPKAGKASGGN